MASRLHARLDFRFADEADAEDISSLVNAAFEAEPEGGLRKTTRVDLKALGEELERSKDVKWVVLETAVPVGNVKVGLVIECAPHKP